MRIRRSLIGVLALALIAAACWQNAARFFALPTLQASHVLPDSFWGRGDVRHKLAVAASRAGLRKASLGPRVYPYSVIPGGVRDANELREIAARDYVVARHFSEFNFQRAHLVQVSEPHAVYLSYRIRDEVYWTHKQVLLPAGELLLTDGKIAARTRCGNQVSEQPKPEVSPEEPAAEVLDQPMGAVGPATATLPFRSALSAPAIPGEDPLPPNPPALFAAGYMFPYAGFGAPIPSGLCETQSQENYEQAHGIVDNESKEKHCVSNSPRSHKPPVIPEPSTYLLISSGLAAVFWRYRRCSNRPASE